jgi:hypothetical protein
MNDPDIDVPAIADYIADMTRELSAMARSARMDLLAYLLEMAAEEAKSRSRDINGPALPHKNGQRS